jgi:hypothetical protein
LSIDPAFADGLLELDRRKNARSLSTNGTESGRIDAQGFEDGRRHLGGAHFGADRLGFEGRIGQRRTATPGQPRVGTRVGQILGHSFPIKGD